MAVVPSGRVTPTGRIIWKPAPSRVVTVRTPSGRWSTRPSDVAKYGAQPTPAKTISIAEAEAATRMLPTVEVKTPSQILKESAEKRRAAGRITTRAEAPILIAPIRETMRDIVGVEKLPVAPPTKVEALRKAVRETKRVKEVKLPTEFKRSVEQISKIKGDVKKLRLTPIKDLMKDVQVYEKAKTTYTPEGSMTAYKPTTKQFKLSTLQKIQLEAQKAENLGQAPKAFVYRIPKGLKTKLKDIKKHPIKFAGEVAFFYFAPAWLTGAAVVGGAAYGIYKMEESVTAGGAGEFVGEVLPYIATLKGLKTVEPAFKISSLKKYFPKMLKSKAARKGLKVVRTQRRQPPKWEKREAPQKTLKYIPRLETGKAMPHLFEKTGYLHIEKIPKPPKITRQPKFVKFKTPPKKPIKTTLDTTKQARIWTKKQLQIQQQRAAKTVVAKQEISKAIQKQWKDVKPFTKKDVRKMSSIQRKQRELTLQYEKSPRLRTETGGVVPGYPRIVRTRGTQAIIRKPKKIDGIMVVEKKVKKWDFKYLKDKKDVVVDSGRQQFILRQEVQQIPKQKFVKPTPKDVKLKVRGKDGEYYHIRKIREESFADVPLKRQELPTIYPEYQKIPKGFRSAKIKNQLMAKLQTQIKQRELVLKANKLKIDMGIKAKLKARELNILKAQRKTDLALLEKDKALLIRTSELGVFLIPALKLDTELEAIQEHETIQEKEQVGIQDIRYISMQKEQIAEQIAEQVAEQVAIQDMKPISELDVMQITKLKPFPTPPPFPKTPTKTPPKKGKPIKIIKLPKDYIRPPPPPTPTPPKKPPRFVKPPTKKIKIFIIPKIKKYRPKLIMPKPFKYKPIPTRYTYTIVRPRKRPELKYFTGTELR